jgi:SPP1 family predicted phage head-tail adaptor
MALKLGAMRFRVRIEQRTTQQADSGEPLDQWDFFASRRAGKKVMTGSERFAAQQQFGRLPTVFQLRYLAGVLPSMRLISDGKIYDVVSAVDPDGTKAELEITALELVGEPAPVDENLIAWWAMEDGSAYPDAIDSAGSNILEPAPDDAPAPALVLGRVGRLARSFVPDLTEADLVAGMAGLTTLAVRSVFRESSYSVALWLNPATIPVDLGGGTEFDLSTLLALTEPGTNADADLVRFVYRAPFGMFTIGFEGAFLDAAGVITPDAWTHLAATYERLSPTDGTFRLYQDGVKVAEETGWTLPAEDRPTARWQMGGLPDVDASGIHSPVGYPLYGQLDDVRVYDKALSDAEVLALFQGEAT